MTIGRQSVATTYLDDVDANGQALRYWLPASPNGTLVIWSHPDSQTQQIDPTGYWAYPLIHSLVQEGYAVVASNQHNRSWGSDAALTDTVAAYTFMTGKMTVAKVILAGGSMGGLPSLLLVAKGSLPVGKVKGVALIDGVTNLRAMYEAGTYTTVIETAYGITRGTLSAAMASTGLMSVPTTASFPTIGTQLVLGVGTANTEVVTTTGASTGTAVAVTATTKTHASADVVSDYGTKTATHDPMLFSASVFAGLRYRFWASTADTSVSKTNNADAFNMFAASGATELVVKSHALGHLDMHGVWPLDFMAFIRRCV